jgi:hypothetical protein
LPFREPHGKQIVLATLMMFAMAPALRAGKD